MLKTYLLLAVTATALFAACSGSSRVAGEVFVTENSTAKKLPSIEINAYRQEDLLKNLGAEVETAFDSAGKARDDCQSNPHLEFVRCELEFEASMDSAFKSAFTSVRPIATARSDSNGVFQMDLPEGKYIIQASTSVKLGEHWNRIFWLVNLTTTGKDRKIQLSGANSLDAYKIRNAVIALRSLS